MDATPPLPPLVSTPPGFVERRRLPDRRRADRRFQQSAPPRDRRAAADRRHPLPRRETSAGHLRNALQALTLLNLSRLDDAERKALRAAAERLWLALFEVQRPPQDPPNRPF